MSSYVGARSASMSSSEEQKDEQTDSSSSESLSDESQDEEANELEAIVEVYGWERGGGGGTSMSWMISTVGCWWR